MSAASDISTPRDHLSLVALGRGVQPERFLSRKSADFGDADALALNHDTLRTLIATIRSWGSTLTGYATSIFRYTTIA